MTPISPSQYGTWVRTNRLWLKLDRYERVVVMAYMEADPGPNAAEDRKHIAAAILNRAAKGNFDVGEQVSTRIYQPTFEPAQERRVPSSLMDAGFEDLLYWVIDYAAGRIEDPTGGATHYLAKPSVMLALEAREPKKYRSWRSWTGFNASTKTYANQTMEDHSHAFLAPEGRYSIPMAVDAEGNPLS